MAHIQGVTGAGVVHVVLSVTLNQTVVGLVVDASEADGWAHVVALSGVVVDHVEDNLNPRIVKCAHHALELADCAAWLLGSRVVLVWRQEAEGVVAPVVAQPLFAQVVVLEELVDRHQFDSRDTKVLEVVNNRRMSETGIGTA